MIVTSWCFFLSLIASTVVRRGMLYYKAFLLIQTLVCSVSLMLASYMLEWSSQCGFKLALAKRGLYARIGRQKWSSNHFPGSHRGCRQWWTDAEVPEGAVASSWFLLHIQLVSLVADLIAPQLFHAHSWTPCNGLTEVVAAQQHTSHKALHESSFVAISVVEYAWLLRLPGWLISPWSSHFLFWPPLAQPFF